MNIKFTISFGIGAVMALALAVQAQNLTQSTSTTANWLGTPPVFQTGAAPTAGSGGTSQDNDNWGGNANGVNGFGALGQAFTVTSGGTLGSFQMVFAGGPATFNVELYDMGPTPTGYQAAPGNTPTITQINNIGNVAPYGTPPTLYGGLNLLQSGDSFNYYGTAGQNLVTLLLGGADANVQLVTGELYVLSLDPQANADGVWWVRGGVPISAYNTGEGLNADGVAGMQDFEGKSSVRDFDLAVTLVPEPSAMALLGLSGLVGTFVARRKRV